VTTIDLDSANPFIRYRRFLDSFGRARAAGWSDADFISMVERLDEAIADVDGHGFRVTPFGRHPDLAAALELPTDEIWLKDDTHNVGGSHKARHLFGVMLHDALDAHDVESELAIASCGNAALAAAVVARAQERPLRVFIPTWAEPPIVERLQQLGATIEVCERRPGESGDPTYLRFLEAVDRGATPFSVQSTVTPTTIDGGKTLGWEVAEQLGDLGIEGRLQVMLQVGGGAMASAVAAGIADGLLHDWVRVEPIYHPVQTDACAPLYRAWDLLLKFGGVGDGTDSERSAEVHAKWVEGLVEVARSAPDRFMFPWEPVGESVASGILDDFTYDWLGVLEPTLRSGGWPVVIDEATALRAHAVVNDISGIRASATGTAGVAGLLDRELAAAVASTDRVLALVTGIER
jgi:threonine synthase